MNVVDHSNYNSYMIILKFSQEIGNICTYNSAVKQFVNGCAVFCLYITHERQASAAHA